jgi:hypothetical protein
LCLALIASIASLGKNPCNDAKLKIIPANQSLILAGEPTGSSGPSSMLGQASRLVAGGGALKRVTIFEASANATVVVQADYFSREEASAAGTQRAAGLEVSHHAPAIPSGSSTSSGQVTLRDPTLSGTATPSHYLSPTQLYARTQRGLAPKSALLDVLA